MAFVLTAVFSIFLGYNFADFIFQLLFPKEKPIKFNDIEANTVLRSYLEGYSRGKEYRISSIATKLAFEIENKAYVQKNTLDIEDIDEDIIKTKPRLRLIKNEDIEY